MTKVFTGALVALALAAPASAEHFGGRYDRGRRYSYRYVADAFRVGLDRGYEAGLRDGRRDGARGDYWFSRDRFHRGDAGYRRSFGPRHEYVRGFRSGYERGYRDGYEAHRGRHGRYGYRGGRYYKTYPYRY